MSRRMEKVADLLQSEIAELLQRRVKHPAIERAMVSITHVDVAPDLANARIHVSVMAEAEEQAEVLDALGRSASFLHRELTKRIRIRRVPLLRFELDHSIGLGRSTDRADARGRARRGPGAAARAAARSDIGAMSREEPAIVGFINVDKPPEMTSFDVVRAIRRASGVRRVGHAGTLDRPATGGAAGGDRQRDAADRFTDGRAQALPRAASPWAWRPTPTTRPARCRRAATRAA